MLIDFRELFPRWNINPKGVLHCGANIGEEAPVYRQLGLTRQIWIEANYDLMDKLRSNLVLPYEVAYCFCVGDEHDKEITFHISNNGSQSSSILDLGTHKIAHPEVYYTEHRVTLTKRIDQYFEEKELIGLDFLNIDLQGAELKALKGMGKLLNQFKWAYLEVNKEELYKGCALVEDIDFYLSSFGFTRVETMWCGNTGWGDALYIKQ